MSILAPTTALVTRTRLARSVIGHLRRALRLRAERRALLTLDAHLLDDVGLTRSQALSEASRPLWDAPATWRK